MTEKNWSLNFDGNKDFVNCGDFSGTCVSDPSISGKLSIEFWANIRGGYYVISSGGQTGSRGFCFSYQNGSSYVSIKDGNYDWRIDFNIKLNIWSHWIMTWDGSVFKLYQNGILIGSDSSPSAVTESDTRSELTLGVPNNAKDNYHCKMNIDEVRIWNYARTQEEIQEDMKDRLIWKYESQPVGLVAYYPLQVGYGDRARDYSDNGNHGSIEGAVWSKGYPFGGYKADFENTLNLKSPRGEIIEPNSNPVVTLREDEGKYGSGVAVEGGTINLIDPKSPPLDSGYDASVEESSEYIIYGDRSWKLINTEPIDLTYRGWKFDTISGEIYIGSIYVYDPYDVIYKMILYDGDIFGEAQSPIDLEGGYKKYVSTGVAPNTGTTSHGMIFYLSEDNTNPVWVSGGQVEKKSFATSFVDGSRGEGELIYPSSIIRKNNFTFKADVKPTSNLTNGTNDNQPILTSRGDMFWFARRDGDNQLSFWYADNSNNESWYMTSSNAILNLNEWNEVALTYDGSTMKMYFNGNLVDSNTNYNEDNIGDILYIGSESEYNREFNGIIDNLEFYPYALSEEEIKNSSNIITDVISDRLVSDIAKPFDNQNAYIGVGDGNQSFNKYQVDLVGDNQVRKQMDSGSYKDIIDINGVLGSYDENQNLISNEGLITPVSNISTIRNKEGKYNGCVAVEESTTNLLDNPSLEGEKDLYSEFRAYGSNYEIVSDPIINNTKSQRIYNLNTSNDGSKPMNEGIYIERSDLSVSTIYILSFYGKGWKDEYGDIDFYINIGSFTILKKEQLFNDWYRYEVKITTDINGDFRIYIRPHDNKIYDYDCLINAPQIEKKSFATSFVEGNRGIGVINYPDFFNINGDWTIIFWVRILEMNSNGILFTINRGTHINLYNGGSGEYVISLYNGTTQSQYNSSQYVSGEFDFISLSKSGSNYSFCVNGNITNFTDSKVLDTSFNLISLGGYDGNSTYISNALFDELVILPYAVSDSQVQEWYNQGGVKAYPHKDRTSLKLKSTFDYDEANFEWNEFGVFNSKEGGDMLIREIESLGRKSNKHKWELEVEVDLDI